MIHFSSSLHCSSCSRPRNEPGAVPELAVPRSLCAKCKYCFKDKIERVGLGRSHQEFPHLKHNIKVNISAVRPSKDGGPRNHRVFEWAD